MAAVDMNVSTVVSIEEALRRLCQEISSALSIERVPLQSSVGRILAEAFVTPFPMPPFRRSAMDGYAVRSSVTRTANPDHPTRLRVIDEWRAGDCKNEMKKPAEEELVAVRIFTGAPVPETFDTVIMQEAVSYSTDGMDSASRYVHVKQPAVAGKHVAEAGEDVPCGQQLLSKGTVIGVKEIAILASYGLTDLPVFKKPVVAIIPVGDELLKPGAALKPSHIYDSNSFSVEALVRVLGAETIRYDAVSDHLDDIAAALNRAWLQADLIVTTGGVSVGDYDFVARAAQRIGCESVFTKVLMRPGTPTSAYRRDTQFVICLSGNPSACYSGLELLVKPAVLRLMGKQSYAHRWLEGELAAPVSIPCPYPRYIRSYAAMEGGQYTVVPIANDKSGNIAAFAEANAIAEIRAGGKGATAGDKVRFIYLT